MEPIVGVFASHYQVIEAGHRLKDKGLRRVTLLMPGEPKGEVERAVRTEDMEQPGIGSALGGAVGGALGIAGGIELGATVANLLVPGIGPVLAVGFLGAAVVGAAGAAAGVAAGRAIESSLGDGLPKDELFLYEDALRHGRSVLIVWAYDQAEQVEAGDAMARAGAESLDAARRRWWLGLRPAEEEQYRADGSDFSQDEESYRRGFEAALRVDLRGKSYEAALNQLRDWYAGECNASSFRRGYERGLNYYRGRQSKYRGYTQNS
jgi:hypothetical protein